MRQRKTSKQLRKLDAANAAYAERLTSVLEALGCKRTSRSSYDYELQTRAGRLLVSAHPNLVQPGAWVAAMFEEPARAVRILGSDVTKLLGTEVNPYTGKWNHYFFDESVEEAETELREKFRRILEER